MENKLLYAYLSYPGLCEAKPKLPLLKDLLLV